MLSHHLLALCFMRKCCYKYFYFSVILSKSAYSVVIRTSAGIQKTITTNQCVSGENSPKHCFADEGKCLLNIYIMIDVLFGIYFKVFVTIVWTS